MARSSVNLKRALLIALLAIGTATLAAMARIARSPMPNPKRSLGVPSASARAIPVLWNAPAFSFVSQKNQRITSRGLAGHVWIANFIFTQCSSTCPMITAKMVLLQRRLADPKLRFVSFSVDPAHDTPDILAKYADAWQSNEQRWLLLSTDPSGLEAVTRGLHVALKKTGDSKNPIAHTSQFFLVDTQGSVRGIYPSDNDAALARLADDATALAQSEPPRSTAVQTSGARLYADLGCDACHARPDLAPSLRGLLGRTVLLDDGLRVTVNTSYIREAIAHPEAGLVAGYARLMPEYGELLSGPEIQRLAEYVESLPADRATSPCALASNDDSQAVVQVDPVCGMRVRVSATTARATYAERQYLFCSDACRQRFEAAPNLYVTKQQPLEP